ncbi:heme exporter protein CcmD [Azospirillum isscasi]|uniref:Heme exporter protein D n=1 Tax=Azospirillum isscasi TaxID=3053926 RepID=A0ABU0WHK8_9PROT|nr:heme exporter protein CcmD [Azospirillum isscasi]MDQ2103646.1 heme exporter protein CcmD [Azospirillum isscasi]
MAEFFAMGGYAAYVWSSYALAALVMVGLLAATLKALRGAETTLKALEGSRPPRRRRQQRNGAAASPAAEVGEG